jgi:DNA-binding PadR family transcriptional regulator
VLKIQQGSLYPALYRLEQKGLITYDWAVSENGRKAKYYRLTSLGQKRLETETASWERLSTAINRVLRTV